MDGIVSRFAILNPTILFNLQLNKKICITLLPMIWIFQIDSMYCITLTIVLNKLLHIEHVRKEKIYLSRTNRTEKFLYQST
jgi:hypothetical protein